MKDYQKDYAYAQMSNQAYQDHPKPPAGWQVLPGATISDKNTGFAVTAFQNPNTKEIVIAYRGTDNLKPWAVGNDVSADLAIMGKQPWDPQFTQALDYAQRLLQAHPQAAAAGKISVTGHSLGGSLAQVSSQMLGLRGITFDPGGAANLVQSQAFKDWASAHDLPPQGRGMPASFDNYIVNHSAVSNLSGPHVGAGTPVSGTAGRSWLSQAAGSVPYVRVGGLASAAAYGASQGYDQLQRHSMERIEKVFEDAARSGHLNQIGQITTPEHKKQFAALSGQIEAVLPTLDASQNTNLTFYAALQAGKAQLPLQDIVQVRQVELAHLPAGKTLLGLADATGERAAAADIGKGSQQPAAQSLQALAQELAPQVQQQQVLAQRHALG